MTVKMKLFAILREKVGVGEVALDLADGTTVAQAGEALAGKFPQVRDHLKRIAYAVNFTYVPATTVLKNGDEVALIPPVSGG